jgi:hypothetical protein
VDIDPEFHPTICADVTKLTAREIIFYAQRNSHEAYSKVVYLMSPPCERYSLARRTWPEKGIKNSLLIAGSCLEIVAEARDYVASWEALSWALESPKARLRWFLGKPALTINWSDYGSAWKKPTDIWTNVHLPMIEARGTPTGSPNELWSSKRAERAAIPIGLSQAFLEGVEAKPAAAASEGAEQP